MILITINIWSALYISQAPNYDGINNSTRNDCERMSDYECFDLEGLWPPGIDNQSLTTQEEYFDTQPLPTPDPDDTIVPDNTDPTTTAETSLSSLAIWIIIWILLVVILVVITYFRINKK